MRGIKKRKQATRKSVLPMIVSISPFLIPEAMKKKAQAKNKIQPHK